MFIVKKQQNRNWRGLSEAKVPEMTPDGGTYGKKGKQTFRCKDQ